VKRVKSEEAKRERVFKINKTKIWLRRDQVTPHHLITVNEEF
jgi:hypothetical protein